MRNFYHQIMLMDINPKARVGNDISKRWCYDNGHNDARHAAAEIATEADARIAELEAEIEQLKTKQDFMRDKAIEMNGHLDRLTGQVEMLQVMGKLL